MLSPYSIRRETDSAVSELSYFEGHFVTSSEHLSTPSEPPLPVQMAVTSLPNVDAAAPS